MKKTGWILALATLPLAAASCDDDSTGLRDDVLAEQEAQELANVMIASLAGMAQQEVSEVSTSSALAPGTTSPSAVTELDLDWNGVNPCDPSGEVAIEGQVNAIYDDQTEEGTASIDVTLTHDDCTYVTENGTFTVTGRPSLTLRGDFHAVADQPEGEQTVLLEGAFRWEDNADRSGICEVDLEAILVAEGSSLTRTLNGGFCGHTIDLEVEETTG